MQFIVYNDAVKRFKFQCRYMTFIDGDEFIYPKVDRGGHIINIVDEIFSAMPNAGELSISWQCFGSNGQETADYSRGVLERFTRRESKDVNPTNGCKIITDPRKIKYMESPHWAALFEGFFPVTEEKKIKTCARWRLEPPLTEKIVINHYHCKSWEEYSLKNSRGDVDKIQSEKYSRAFFNDRDYNDEFDDGILKYRAERAKVFTLPDRSHAAERLFNALSANLSPTLLPNTPQGFYAGKMETFLTCRAVSAYLKTRLTDAAPAEFFEEASLKAILKTLTGNVSLADIQLLLSELPNLLSLPYPVVKDLRISCLNVIWQMMNLMRLNNKWKDFNDLDYLQRLLQTWK